MFSWIICTCSTALPNIFHIMVQKGQYFYSTPGKDKMLVVTQLYPGCGLLKVLRTQALDRALTRSPSFQTTLSFYCDFCSFNKICYTHQQKNDPRTKWLTNTIQITKSIKDLPLILFLIKHNALKLKTKNNQHLVISFTCQLCEIYKITCVTYVHYIKNQKRQQKEINLY